MREMTIREAEQSFAQIIAAAEKGETIIITRDGAPIAKISQAPEDKTKDPEWQAALARLKDRPMRPIAPKDFRVGEITEDDLYG